MHLSFQMKIIFNTCTKFKSTEKLIVKYVVPYSPHSPQSSQSPSPAAALVIITVLSFLLGPFVGSFLLGWSGSGLPEPSGKQKVQLPLLEEAFSWSRSIVFCMVTLVKVPVLLQFQDFLSQESISSLARLWRLSARALREEVGRTCRDVGRASQTAFTNYIRLPPFHLQVFIKLECFSLLSSLTVQDFTLLALSFYLYIFFLINMISSQFPLWFFKSLCLCLLERFLYCHFSGVQRGDVLEFFVKLVIFIWNTLQMDPQK